MTVLPQHEWVRATLFGVFVFCSLITICMAYLGQAPADRRLDRCVVFAVLAAAAFALALVPW